MTEIYDYLKEKSPEAILYDNCDSALVGTARLKREDQWVEVAIYSYEALVEHFKNEFLSDKEETLSEDDAEVEQWNGWTIMLLADTWASTLH